MIGNPNEKEAKLRVDKGGEYVVRLTVTDEDKTSSTEVTVTMTDAADGIQRVKTVITQVGVAPTLPNGVVAVRDDGTYSGGAVDWDEISEDKYAQAGEFEAYGTLRTQTTRVAIKVVVVKGDRKNVALFATPTAIINTPSDLGGVAGLNDGFDPSSSRDTSHGVWHNWQGAQGDAAWVMYTWDVPVTIDGADAYYFTDGNFAPKDAKLEYLAEDGQWHEVPNVSGLGVTLNQYNTTSFDPITTTKLRMTMNPKTLGIGVIEWKVYGYGEFVDRSALKSAIATAKGINTNLFVEGSKYLLDLAIAKAQAVLSDTAATQEQVDAAAAELNAVIAGLESADDFESKLAQLADQSQSNLVMSSPVITTQAPLVKGDNYLGYASMGSENINGIAEPVEITRLAARLDLVNVKTDFTKTLLRNRTVRVEEVTILNQSTASRFFSRDYWGVVMATGHLGNSDATALNRDIANGSPINDTPYVHYVMENDGSEAPTEIQVRATLLETDTYEAETKIFTAVINRNGLDRGYNHNYVKRNYVYRLNVTFGDTSFDGNHEKDPNIPIPPRPTTGDLDVQVEVVNWGQVSQDVEI